MIKNIFSLELSKSLVNYLKHPSIAAAAAITPLATPAVTGPPKKEATAANPNQKQVLPPLISERRLISNFFIVKLFKKLNHILFQSA